MSIHKTHFFTGLKKCVIVPYVAGDKWDAERWITLTEIVLRMSNGRILSIPSGFVTNFGSIPKALQSFLNKMGHSLLPFVLHDFLYSILLRNFADFNDYTQEECDDMLFDLGREFGEGWCAATAINTGLDIGGFTCFKKTEPVFEEISESVLHHICNSNGYQLAKDGEILGAF